MINNLASGANNMLFIADNTTWGTATSGIQFSQTNGLEIKAAKVIVSAGNLLFSSDSADTATKAFSDLNTAITNITNGTTSVPHVEATGISINGNAITIASTGTVSMAANSSLTMMSDASNSAVTINKDGITLASGKALIISTTNCSLNDTGFMTLSGASIGGWQVVSSYIYKNKTGIGTIYLGTENRSINVNDKFEVDYAGNVWLHALYVDG
jgi:hypothetical protein